MDNQNILLQQIRQKLEPGDHHIIARVVRCPIDMVTLVLMGETCFNKDKTRRIINTAKSIIETRQQMRDFGYKW